MSSVLERSRFVLVIGGGQAGLAAGYWLKRQDIPFLIVEGSARIGDVWRQRYASLSLFTTRAFSALPGMALAGKAQGYAGRDEFADYLEAYARRFALPIRLSTSVQRLRAGPHGSFLADLSDGGTLAATHVIVATGGFQAPVVPAIARGFGAQIPQLTPESFGAGESLPDGPVLVVGEGQRPRPGRAGLGLASGDAGHGQAAQAGARACAGPIDLVVAAQPGADARVVRVIHRQGIATQGPLSRS